MALSIDYLTKIITVPISYLGAPISTSPFNIYNLDTNLFRLDLKNIEDDEQGVVFIDTHRHNTEVTVGGVTLGRVFEIINGYTITFENGSYAVNLLGSNNNISDVLNLNDVQVRSSNSAGLVTSVAIEFGEYGGEVTLDAVNGFVGTVYPTGTLRRPAKTLSDAKIIAVARGFSRIKVLGDFVFGASDTLDGYSVHGESPTKTSISLTGSALIQNCVFEDATISGTLDGGCGVTSCQITNVNYVDGDVHDCQLNAGTILLSGDRANFIRCWSGVPGIDTPTIDMGGTGTELLIRDYQGGIELINYLSGSEDISIDMASGHLKLGTSILAGYFLVRGLGKLTDESNGAVVNSDDLINKALLTEITDLVTDFREENPNTQEITKKIWQAELIDVDDEEQAGYLLYNAAEIVGKNLVTPAQLVNAVWNKDMTGAFGPSTAGGLLKKSKLIYKILIS